MSQYKYYFKKPRGKIVKDILLWLMVGGMVAVASTSPSFLYRMFLGFQKSKKYRKQSVLTAFSRLRKEGLLIVQKHNNQMYASLSDEGRRKAGRFQIEDLEIKKPKKWDKKWRVVIFDVSNKQKMKREVLRGFLKRLGFYKLQQSVWIHPFDCSSEVDLLKSFFGFTQAEIRFIVAETIDGESAIKEKFHLL